MGWEGLNWENKSVEGALLRAAPGIAGPSWKLNFLERSRESRSLRVCYARDSHGSLGCKNLLSFVSA